MSTIQSIIQSTIRPVISSVIGDDGFTPAVLSNRAVWLNAKRLPTSTTLISSAFNDNNLGVGNATQAVGLRQPLYVANAINGRPAMRGWHGDPSIANNSNLTIADSVGLNYTSFEVYAVVRRHGDAGGDERICGKAAASAPNREFVANIGVGDNLVLGCTVDGTTFNFASSNASVPAQTIVLNQPRICRFSYDQSLSTQRMKVFMNNVQGDFNSTPPTSVNQTTEPFTLFSRSDFLNGFRGDIGELLFFTRILTTNERTALMNYLSREWGIAI